MGATLDARPATVADALALGGALESLDPFVGGVSLGERAAVGSSTTLDLWEMLATLAAADLSLARAVEPHVDAVTILHQAGVAPGSDVHPPRSTWGVFAAEGGGMSVTATQTGDGWRLHGTKPWCSLAGTLTHALVTAWVAPAFGSVPERRLFAVALAHDGVRVDPTWTSLGLPDVPSGPVAFEAVPATPVGESGWYLERPGFAWGGISVAACWFGGAVGVARTLATAARTRPADDVLTQLHVGRVDVALHEARTALISAAAAIDDGGAAGSAGTLLAKRVRATVARCVEDVLRAAAHALGPAPLVQDPAHAKRVADLELYVRQHHAERDDASLGRAVLGGGVEW
ncbi:acyl-CoA dehydrogenase family protein [Frondihabitans cladoniiphilus]|uniref:acyl-CoA dehydrogenase family protein n=1 Tax=Frondihabitans cladoniiphilus TaxID=715785 RepID=UPI0031E59DF9